MPRELKEPDLTAGTSVPGTLHALRQRAKQWQLFLHWRTRSGGTQRDHGSSPADLRFRSCKEGHAGASAYRTVATLASALFSFWLASALGLESFLVWQDPRTSSCRVSVPSGVLDVSLSVDPWSVWSRSPFRASLSSRRPPKGSPGSHVQGPLFSFAPAFCAVSSSSPLWSSSVLLPALVLSGWSRPL